MRLAAQLYTLRDYTKTRDGFEECLARCAAIGYAGVQLSAVGCMNGDEPEVDAAAARELLDRYHLICCATHRPQDRLVEHTDAEIAFHKTLGCDYTAVGGAFGTGDKASGYRDFLQQTAPMIERFAVAGIRFGYHNHAHEFIREDRYGPTMMDLLIAEGPSALQFEIDTFWVVHAGADLIPLLERLRGRLAMVHAKDREVISQKGPVMAPVGEGNLNWDAILPVLADAGTEWVIVEQDECQRDPFDCLASSHDFLAARL